MRPSRTTCSSSTTTRCALDNLVVTAPDGSAVKPENMHKGKLRSVFDLNLAQPGTYRIAVLNDGVFARWKDKATGQTKRARGTPENIASQIPADAQEVEVTQSAGRIETFVTVGKPSALKPSGKGLELVTAANPTDLVKGEKASFSPADRRPAGQGPRSDGHAGQHALPRQAGRDHAQDRRQGPVRA